MPHRQTCRLFPAWGLAGAAALVLLAGCAPTPSAMPPERRATWEKKLLDDHIFDRPAADIMKQ